jgi:Raf kinase inhibitor-like YbhB/YbcL family protein
MPIKLSSPAFADGGDVPIRHTCDGDDLSPRLTWSDVPEGTRSLALIVDDPDAPRGTFTHWVLYDIPPDTNELAESLPAGTIGIAGRNSFGRSGYGGPCPPPEHQAHRYRFTLYALDMPSLGLAANATREEVDAKMQNHILAEVRLVGKYRRQVPAGTR